jgi:putative FmdB family regulatory protein
MPIYEYRCPACGTVFSRLFQRLADAEQVQCATCGNGETQRLISSFAVGGRVNPGPGRAAWPTSWNDTNGGDPETLRYWRKRIEREARLEEKYPELRDPSLLNGSGTGTLESSEHSHSHEVHHHHHGEHHHHHAPVEAGGGSSTESA